jgi:hypothetical protein
MSDATARSATPAPGEARCQRCAETFEVQPGQTELMHVQRRDGQLGGGDGVPFRKYVIRNPNRI